MPHLSNAYHDEQRAMAYADVGIAGTYYLAFRDLPDLFARHVRGHVALDFGCGAGRSTRFLKTLDFDVVGADISKPMLVQAKQRDLDGNYVLIPDGDLSPLHEHRFDLILSTFAFDNIPTHKKRSQIFAGLGGLLTDTGKIVNVVSAQELYQHEWTSFSTKNFAENRTAKTGDIVRIVMLDGSDRRPVDDVFWTHESYESLFVSAGLELVETHRPLGRADDPFPWLCEDRVSPWAIHVLAAKPNG